VVESGVVGSGLLTVGKRAEENKVIMAYAKEKLL